MSKIYALLVGINDYSPKVGKLQGCVNDVDNFQAFLKSNYEHSSLAIEMLKDQDATYDNIIRQFHSHLCRAQEGDVAVFQYCGHGARSTSAPEFREFYNSGKDEGLVCIDSREPGGFDLADKELAVLISEVARNDPHIAVLLDCCHSGSGTRNTVVFDGLRVRMTHERLKERPMESYIGGHYMDMRKRGESLYIPASKHILLAACDRKQTAKETLDKSGVFTSSLLEVLEAERGNISYSGLFVRTRTATRNRANHQDPQFETFGNFHAAGGFLGKDVTALHQRARVYYDQNDWKVECGAMHGVPTDPGTAVELAVYYDSVQKTSIGSAGVRQVGPTTSLLQPQFSADRATEYCAEIASLPVAPMLVRFDGPSDWKMALQDILAQNGSIGVELTDSDGTRYALEKRDNSLVLIEQNLDLLVQGVELGTENPADNISAILPVLKHVMQWERAISLQNQHTRMKTGSVDCRFSEQSKKGESFAHDFDEITVDYRKEGADWQSIKGKIQLRNNSHHLLHYVLIYYSKDYGIQILRNDQVEPGEDYVTIWGDDSKLFLYLEDNENESIESFKLIISSERIDDFLLDQKALLLGEIIPSMRAMSDADPTKKLGAKNDWFTKDCRIKIVRQQDKIGKRDVTLAHGRIKIRGHDTVTGGLGLSAAIPSVRNVAEGQNFLEPFEKQGLELVNFAEPVTRGENEDILELTDIKNATDLEDNPLELELDVDLEKDQAIIALVFDGQHFLLGGDAYRDDTGITHVSIDHLYDIPDNRRSVGSALKLYFFKTYLKRNTNKLRWVDFQSDDQFERNGDRVAEKVAAAKNILLLIHGLIGDTKHIAQGIRNGGLHRNFDLVLAYDYENLNTPIGETADDLKAKLAEVGLIDGDGKRLTILAHSMGGLVSRSFIEQGRGDKVADHLVMCGTPNHGSPFGKIDDARKILNLLTVISMNFVPALVPFSGPFLMLLNRTKNVTRSLEQMDPDSQFLKRLNNSDDPGIPYTVLAGDVGAYEEPTDQYFSDLLVKASKVAGYEKLFADKPHDIAVGIDSIKTIGNNRIAQPTFNPVACHHLNYFSSDVGQEALNSVDWDIREMKRSCQFPYLGGL